MYNKLKQQADKFTPWEIFGIVLAIITFMVLAIVWNNFTSSQSKKMLDYMRENPAEVQQWLRDNEGR